MSYFSRPYIKTCNALLEQIRDKDKAADIIFEVLLSIESDSRYLVLHNGTIVDGLVIIADKAAGKLPTVNGTP